MWCGWRWACGTHGAWTRSVLCGKARVIEPGLTPWRYSLGLGFHNARTGGGGARCGARGGGGGGWLRR